MGKANFDVLIRPSLVGLRRVQAAVTRRLLEDARERHTLRGSYQARAEHSCGNEGYLSTIRVEAFNDVRGAVRASLCARNFIQILQDDATAIMRRKRLMRKFRCIAFCIGTFKALHGRVVRRRQAADSAWRELRESIATASMSLGLASFALGSKAVKSVRLGSMAVKSMGLGSMGVQSVKLDARPSDQRGNQTPPISDQLAALGGGNVAVAFRSMRKVLANTRGVSLPRSPGALLKSANPTMKGAIPARPNGAPSEAQRRRSKRSASRA